MKTVPFNAEQAKAGRPVGLKNYKGVIEHTGKVLSIHNDCVWFLEDGDNSPLTYMTSRLFHPADPCPGHNPAQLDEWTVGTHEGYRTLAAEEFRKLNKETLDAEYYFGGEWAKGGCCIDNPDLTYRTRKPPGFFLPKVVTRNLRPDEWPKDCLLRDQSQTWLARNHAWTDAQIELAMKYGWLWSRSLDGPWKPFTVEETK